MAPLLCEGSMTSLVLHIPGQPPIPLVGPDGTWTLGRSSQNDLVIPDGSLSRHHARLDLRDGIPYVEDLSLIHI